MALHRIRLRAVGLETRGNVIVARTARVKPVFEGCAPAAMPEHAAIPHALQRRRLVVTRAAPSFEREIGICSDRDRQDVIFLSMVRWNGEAVGWRQLVVRI